MGSRRMSRGKNAILLTREERVWSGKVPAREGRSFAIFSLIQIVAPYFLFRGVVGDVIYFLSHFQTDLPFEGAFLT